MATVTPANADVASAIEDAQDRLRRDNPKSQTKYQQALAAMPGGNTRSVLYYPPFPLTITAGKGARLWDLDGHEYADFLCEYTAGLYGHSHPVIRAAIDRALDAGIALGGHNNVEGAFAAALCKRFPSIEKVRFTNSGTEANMMAIGLARAHTKRDKVMVMEGGYHGGVLYFAPGGSPVNAPFDYVLGHINDVEQTRNLIREHGDNLACVITEAMLGGAGCLSCTAEFLTMLRQETERCGALLIFDEVMTSRLGPGGLQEILGIHADLTSLGKYVGGGMSFGAFGGRAEIMDRFDPRREDALPHAGTFNNNLLTMSAGLAGLTEVYTEQAATELNLRGDQLRDRLNEICARHKANLCFSGRGSMLAAHFRAEPPRNLAEVADARRDLHALLHLDLLAQGIYSAPRGMFVLSLPMIEADFAGLCQGLDEFLSTRQSLVCKI